MRKIKVVITLDDNKGLMFNKRRQSRDKAVIADLCQKTKGFIYITRYSAILFEEYPNRTKIVDNPISECLDDYYAFVEGCDLSGHTQDIDELIVYNWNKLYPSDLKLEIDINESFKMVDRYEFQGNSHDKITKEIYKKI